MAPEEGGLPGEVACPSSGPPPPPRAGNGLALARSGQEGSIHEERRRAAEDAAESDGAGEPLAPLVYRLASEVPDPWIPLVPVSVDPEEGKVRLRRGAMTKTLPDGSQVPVQPQGRILEPDTSPFLLYEEEVPRSGVLVSRGYQYARWTDGSTHLWIGRRRRPGGGEGSSGLRFDVVEPT